MKDKCLDCEVSRTESPDCFYDGHPKCVDCEAKEELDKCDIDELRETISMLRYNITEIHKIATRYAMWVHGDLAIEAIREIQEITNKQRPTRETRQKT